MSDANQLQQESIKPVSKTTTIIKWNLIIANLKIVEFSSYVSVWK